MVLVLVRRAQMVLTRALLVLRLRVNARAPSRDVQVVRNRRVLEFLQDFKIAFLLSASPLFLHLQITHLASVAVLAHSMIEIFAIAVLVVLLRSALAFPSSFSVEV